MNINHKQIKIANFTIIEMLVVLAVIIILIGMGLGVFSYAGRKVTDSRTRATIAQISLALEAYKNEHGYYLQRPTGGPVSLKSLAKYLDNETMKGNSISSEEINLCRTIDPKRDEKSLGLDTYEKTIYIDGKEEKGPKLDDYNQPIINVMATGQFFLDGGKIYLRYKCPGTHNKESFDLWSELYEDLSGHGITNQDENDNITNWK